MANTGVILFLIHQATWLHQRGPVGVRRNFEFPVLCDLSQSLSVLHFHYFKKQAEVFPQSNIFSQPFLEVGLGDQRGFGSACQSPE